MGLTKRSQNPGAMRRAGGGAKGRLRREAFTPETFGVNASRLLALTDSALQAIWLDVFWRFFIERSLSCVLH
jgi:hypothetical protein